MNAEEDSEDEDEANDDSDAAMSDDGSFASVDDLDGNYHCTISAGSFNDTCFRRR